MYDIALHFLRFLYDLPSIPVLRTIWQSLGLDLMFILGLRYPYDGLGVGMGLDSFVYIEHEELTRSYIKPPDQDEDC